MWVLLNLFSIYGSIMGVLHVMYIGTIGILYHDVGIAMGIPTHSVDFKGAM